MATSYRLLRISRWAWIGFAYYFGIVVVGILSGIVPLVMGGEPVTLPMPDGPAIPARLFGAINLFLNAPLSFIILHGIGSLMQAVVEMRDRLDKGAA